MSRPNTWREPRRFQLSQRSSYREGETMKLKFTLTKAVDDESGAVTVDWVVLTAAIVVIGSAVVSVFAPNLTTAANYISSVVEYSGD